MMKPISEHFAEFTQPNFFSRADNEHRLDFHIGLDDQGRKCIEFRSRTFTPRKVTGTNVIEVGQFRNSSYYSIRFSLLDDEMEDLFYKFCEDLVEETRVADDKKTGYESVVDRYYKWKKMFVSAGAAFLSEPQIMGLIGEILFLRGSLADRIGLSAALKSWSGQELTHKDFSYNDTWAESKAISRSSMSVKISSLEQLDSDNDGELAVHTLEKMSENYDGITLNKLIFDTRAMFSSTNEKDDFMAKVSLQGYEYHIYYDSFVYEMVSFHRYAVRDGFPRLTRRNVDMAISKAVYTLSLPEIAAFEIKD